MRHLSNFESFINQHDLTPLNEELVGGVINFFKNLWNKATEELKKLGTNPSIDKVEDWVDKNPMNPTDDTYIFKAVIDDFNEKPEANEQDCLDLIKNILDPETGSLGNQGMQPLYDNILKTFGKDSSTIDIIQFLMETIRNKAIKEYKYAGGPDIQVGKDSKVDPKKIIIDMKDTTHLPDFKKVISTAGDDNKKRKQLALDWVNKTLIPKLDKYLSETVVKDDDIEKYIQSKGKQVPNEAPEGGYKVGDIVNYKKKDGSENQAEILKIDREDVQLKTEKNPNGFAIKLDQIISKVEGEKVEGQEDLVKKLGDLKTKKPEDIRKVSSYVDFISDEKNKDKIAEIEKIIGGE